MNNDNGCIRRIVCIVPFIGLIIAILAFFGIDTFRDFYNGYIDRQCESIALEFQIIYQGTSNLIWSPETRIVVEPFEHVTMTANRVSNNESEESRLNCEWSYAGDINVRRIDHCTIQFTTGSDNSSIRINVSASKPMCNVSILSGVFLDVVEMNGEN